jgi:cell division initiation protein
MNRKSLRKKKMRRPTLVLAVARRESRPYVCPRSTGGSDMSDRMTARDVENQSFGRKLRGYDPTEVDMFLRSVAEEVERLNLEKGQMREDMGRLRVDLEELRSREQMLQKTLVSAQRMTDEMKERAGKEGELLVREARLQADGLLKDAQDRLLQIESDVTRSNLERETLERRLRGILEQHLALLEMRRQASEELDNLRVMPSRVGG